jgi:ferredoxin-thioredoxin reductase catalytic subunit
MDYKIIYNTDTEHVNMIKTALKANNGYCPCRIEKIPENICMCSEFKDQIKDPNFYGMCHCGLYVKVNVSEDE